VEGPKNRWQWIISLSGHLTHAVVACSLTASSHQIYAAGLVALHYEKVSG